MKGINLSFLRTCIAVAEERPRMQLTQTFSALFSALGLPAKAVSTSFGSRVNIAICMQVGTIVLNITFFSTENQIPSLSFVSIIYLLDLLSYARRFHPVCHYPHS